MSISQIQQNIALFGMKKMLENMIEAISDSEEDYIIRLKSNLQQTLKEYEARCSCKKTIDPTQLDLSTPEARRGFEKWISNKVTKI